MFRAMRRASIVTGAAGVHDGTFGRTDASAIQQFSRPLTRPSESTASEQDEDACETPRTFAFIHRLKPSELRLSN